MEILAISAVRYSVVNKQECFIFVDNDSGKFVAHRDWRHSKRAGNTSNKKKLFPNYEYVILGKRLIVAFVDVVSYHLLSHIQIGK